MMVPWISKKKIASKANELINNFQTMAQYRVSPPIPVEDIIERCLKLRLLYDDLEKVLGKGILGATYVESKTICVNERLFENSFEGRLVFTCAHEVGHWVLHRQYIVTQDDDVAGNQAIVCRVRDAKEPIEWQADYFAACLLMPENEIRQAFQKVCGPGPYVIKSSLVEAGDGKQGEQPYVEQWPFIAAAMCEAGGFSNVSKLAMIIRLQDLGLVINKTNTQMNWQSLCVDL